MSVFDAMLRGLLPLVPRRVMWSVARRYVAGDELADALARLDEMEAAGFGTILDVLGEHVDGPAGAEAAAAEYHRALDALVGRDPGTYVSVKPTHLGLALDRRLCERLLDELCARAARDGRSVRFEMEDAPTVDATLDVFEAVAARHGNLGCVLQSRLFRAAADAERLLHSVRPLDVRLVKGVYLEPPSIAWTDDADIRRNWVDLARALLDGGARVAFATHDDHLADAAAALLSERGLPPDSGRTHFQCLMGVRRPFAERVLAQGHPVRIYVPYGRDWHAYSLRRLTRNPDLARAVVASLFRRER